MKRRFRFSILLLAGILLLGAGLAGLASVRNVMQYAFLPPADAGTSMLKFYDESLKDMTAAFPRLTLYGVKAGAELGTEAGQRDGICRGALLVRGLSHKAPERPAPGAAGRGEQSRRDCPG